MVKASIPDSFNCMTLSERYTYISDQGKYIGVRSYYNFYINLYLVGDTFYEVWYFRPDNKIEKIELLNDMKKIDLYIKSMQDSHILPQLHAKEKHPPDGSYVSRKKV